MAFAQRKHLASYFLLLATYHANRTADHPQKDFCIPDGWLLHGKRNSLVLVMHPSDVGEVAPVLNEVTVAPYSEYVVQKLELEFDQ